MGEIYGRDAIEQALKLWREGWKQARRLDLSMDMRAGYLGALAAVVATLETCHTMQELCESYYHQPPAVAQILDVVTITTDGHILNRGTVEDAAYWRRASTLAAK